MQQSKQVTTGLVLRATPTKEADLVLTVLTPDKGRIPVIARGALRKNSALASVCQLLSYSEMTLYMRNNWWQLSEGTTISLFEGIRQDFELLALANYFSEVTETLCGEEQPLPEVLSLLLNALYALSELKKPEKQVKTAFEWRLMAISGFEPFCDGCAVCGKQQPENAMMDVRQGILHCADCKEEGGLSLPLSPGALQALRYILRCPLKKLYQFSLDDASLKQLNQVSEAFVVSQLEKSFRSLDYYKSICLPERD